MAGEEMINLTRLGDFHADMTVDAHILKRSTAYAIDDKVNKGLIYLKCTQAGTTASTALDLTNVSVGDELTDGTAKWKVLSIKGVPEGGGTGAGLEDWESNHDYAVDDIYVYEGEIYKTLIAFTSGATEDERIEINDIVPSVWEENTAYTAGDIIEHTDVTTLKKVYYNVTDDFTSGATFEVTAEMQELQVVEEYVPIELTEDDIKEIVAAFNPVFEEAKGIEYSTEERRIGTWIDGKPLYQITIVDTMPTVTTAGVRVTKTVDISNLNLNIKMCTDIKTITYKDSTLQTTNIPSLSNIDFSNNIGLFRVIAVFRGNSNNTYVDSIFIASSDSGDSELPVYITLQYTKTTD